jgi:hypothetical protein
MWHNGLQHGDGIFMSPEGKQRKGEWNAGKRVQWTDGKDTTSTYTQKFSQYSKDKRISPQGVRGHR